MKNINLLIKPASQSCNMNCSYCFYHHIADNRDIQDYGFMKEKTFKNIIDEVFLYVDGGCINFAFQGGEPTLVGPKFYQDFINYVDLKNTNNTKINYALQTNGILIDDEFCEIFKSSNFLIGLSMDGNKKMHDMNRKFYNNQGTHAAVIRAGRMLDKYQIPYNILAVISKSNATHASKMMNFFLSNNYRYLQFIPCLDALEDDHFTNVYSLNNSDYATFLKGAFDVYYKEIMENRFISERFFDNILGIYLNQVPENCTQKGHCSLQFVVEASGDVFTCDFYAYDEYQIGNFNEVSVDTMINSSVSQSFLTEKNELSAKCRNCEFLNQCRGGCKRYKALDEMGDLQNIYCDAFYEFYSYAHIKFIELAYHLKKNN